MRTLILAASAAMLVGTADAAPWRFDFSGVLGSGDTFGPEGQRAALPDATPFRFTATFDDAGDVTPPAAVLPGWAAYAPITATMTLLGETYDVLGYGDDADAGVSIMLFDPANVFNTGFWAAGIHSNPLNSDTGIIARFGTTDSGLALDSGLVETVFGDYIGAGYVSGKPTPAGPGNWCWPSVGLATCSVEPFILFAEDGSTYELAVASRALDGPLGGVGFSASLAPVPLPAGLPLLAAALAIPLALRRILR